MNKIIFLFVFICSSTFSDWIIINPNNPLPGNRRQMISDGTNVYVVIDQSGNIYKSSNNGYNWSAIGNQLSSGNYVRTIAKINNTIFASDADTLYKTTNEGLNWTKVISNLINPYFAKLDIEGGDIYGSFQQLYKSTNFGINWISINNNNSFGNFEVNNGKILALMGDSILYSSNSGNSWIASYHYSAINYTDVEIADNILLASSSNGGILRSTNSGVNWTQVFNFGVNCLEFSNNTIFAGVVRKGVYRSTNLGVSWESICTFPLDTLSVLDISTSTSNIIGLTELIGFNCRVITRPLSEVIGVEIISSEIPTHYALSQNYPNPFNPSTKILINIKESSDVRLTVYDVLGNEITTLISQEMKSGTYTVDWNGLNYPSGVYFYRIETNHFTETKKMVLSK